MKRCRRKGGQDKCDYVHLGAQFYCICDVSWSVLKLQRISWFAEKQPKHMSSLIALAVVPGVIYRFGLDFGLKIYFLIFHTTEKETFMKYKVSFELYVWFG